MTVCSATVPNIQSSEHGIWSRKGRDATGTLGNKVELEDDWQCDNVPLKLRHIERLWVKILNVKTAINSKLHIQSTIQVVSLSGWNALFIKSQATALDKSTSINVLVPANVLVLPDLVSFHTCLKHRPYTPETLFWDLCSTLECTQAWFK